MIIDNIKDVERLNLLIKVNNKEGGKTWRIAELGKEFYNEIKED